MPVTVMLSALFYCTWNGYIQCKYLLGERVYIETRAERAAGGATRRRHTAFICDLANDPFPAFATLPPFPDLHQYPSSTLTSPHFILGSLIFATGFAINYQSDEILRSLRKPGDTGYKIPHGGAFRYVSAANFFGEILEVSGCLERSDINISSMRSSSIPIRLFKKNPLLRSLRWLPSARRFALRRRFFQCQD